MNVRLIWIAAKFPVGTQDGARHATSVLIRHLVRRNVKIDLLCLTSPDETADPAAAQMALGVSSCSILWRPTKNGIPIPRLDVPYTFRSFSSPLLRTQLKGELLRLLAADHRHPTYLVFDGLHTFNALEPEDLRLFSMRSQGLIYRAHNVETALWEQCAERARMPWTRWFYRYEASLVRTIEQRAARMSTLVAPVSSEDAARFKLLAPRSQIVPVPIGIEFPPEPLVEPVRLGQPDFRVLFIGRLNWVPNRNGLMWFLKTVWPSVKRKRPEAVLDIAGVGDGTWLNRFHRLPGIRFRGCVGRVEPLYQAATVTIAPLFQGSGTRVKLLEAGRYARVAISTALGAEGTGLVPGQSYYQAETAEDWIDYLCRLTPEECRESGWQAFRQLRDRFEASTLASHMVDLLIAKCPMESAVQEAPYVYAAS